MDKYKFGNRLCSLREEKGLSQKELAIILDVSDKAISKWENGQSIPRMETLEKIADVFNVGLEFLLNDNETELERHHVKRDAFRNKENSTRKIFYFLGIGSIVLVGFSCFIDALVYFFFNKSNLADVLFDNIILLAIPIGLLTAYAFINSIALRFVSGIKDFISPCVSTENSHYSFLSWINAISSILSIPPLIIAITGVNTDFTLINYVTIYFVSFALLTINLLTSRYSNITLYFSENGIFEKSIDYGDFHPYSKIENLETNIADIHSGKADKLELKFNIGDKKYKASIEDVNIEKISSYLKLNYNQKTVEENTPKLKTINYVLLGIGAVIMAFGMIMFLGNMQIGTQDVDYTKPSNEFISLDGGTSVVKYNDRLYAFTEQNCAVDVFDINGNFLYANQVPIHQNGESDYYLVNDNLYIVDKNDNIYRYDSDGNYLGRIIYNYYDEDVITVQKYNSIDKLVSTYELKLDFAYPIYFDDDKDLIYTYDYLLSYDGNKFSKEPIVSDDLAPFGSYVDGAVYLEKNSIGEFDGVEYYTYFGDLYASSDNGLKELYSVSLFTWYRHSISACWITGAFGMLFAFFSNKIAYRVQLKKNKKR